MGQFSDPAKNSKDVDDNVDSAELDRTYELAWALFDEQISDAEMAELEGLLRGEKTARESYIRCVQLHADLASHFAGAAKSAKASDPKKPPVLGFLNCGIPLTGIDVPAAGNS